MSIPQTITVLTFGSAAEALGWSSRQLALTSPTPLGEMLARLQAEHPRLAAVRERLRFAINQSYATLDTLVAPGDELALIPPVSGG